MEKRVKSALRFSNFTSSSAGFYERKVELNYLNYFTEEYILTGENHVYQGGRNFGFNYAARH